jgi:PAS domain-containing protein
MAQHEIELILIRQLASHLTMPMFIVDAKGTLVFFNEPAEVILGRHFEEGGEMPLDEWVEAWRPTDEDGNIVEPERLPLAIALHEKRPSYDRFWIQGLDQIKRHIHVVAFPLVGQAHRFVGAAAIYWEGETA